MSTVRPGAVAAIVVGCLALGPFAATAQAGPAWLSPVDLTVAGNTPNFPEVAVDPQGNAVAVWERNNGTNFIIQAATRPAGGSWQAPVDLSAAGKSARFPEVAVDPQGNAVAVWQRDNGANFIIQAASRPAGGNWQPPVDLSATGRSAYDPQVAVDPQGNAVAVWERYDGTNYIAQAASRPAGGSWQAPVSLSAAGQSAQLPQVALDPQGNALAVWARGTGATWIVQAASRPAGGSWQAPVDLSAAGADSEMLPQVAVDPQGNAVAVWLLENGSNIVIQAATRPAGGSWQAPVSLSAAAPNADYPRIAVDPQGNALATWGRSNGTYWTVQAATRPAGGSWQAPVDLSAAGTNAGGAELAFDPQGNAVAIWSGWNKFNWEIQAATRPAGGSWQAPVDLSAAGQNAHAPELAVDSQGNAVAVWEQTTLTSSFVQSAGYDAAGPQLRSLSIPTSGTVGQPLSFSVSPLDVWSALGATNWSFGDGGSASGTSATHTFVNAGSYQVTLTSADGLGNTTSASGTIAIRPCAFAARTVRVKAGKALLKLKGHGAAPCRGVAKLSVRKGHKRLLIGKSAFRIPVGKAHVVPVKLSKKGAVLVRRAGRQGLKARLGGSGVAERAVVLKPA